MEDGLTRPNVCRNMKLPPSIVSTMKRNVNEIEPSIQHVTKVCASHVFANSAKKLRIYCYYRWKT